MKKILFLLAAVCFAVSACMSPATPQAGPTPISEADVQATVAFQVEQTLQSLPTPTVAPSNTPVVLTSTSTPTQAVPTSTPTETQNPTLLTLTATLGTGTVVGTAAGPSLTPNPAPIGTNHYQYYGTMPPNLPFGSISMINLSKLDAYISLQCTTPDGYKTIIEYPVGGSRINTSAPAGKYIYVAWVGGRKSTGNFKLDKLQDLKITIRKDKIEIN